MKPEKQKIKDYAKDLFLQVDENGNKKYSLRDICEKILQKFHKSIDPKTILNWSNKENWINIYSASVRCIQSQNTRQIVSGRSPPPALCGSDLGSLANAFLPNRSSQNICFKIVCAYLTADSIEKQLLQQLSACSG